MFEEREITEEERKIEIFMNKLMWQKEVHLILNKEMVRFHKQGFELPLEFIKEILDNCEQETIKRFEWLKKKIDDETDTSEEGGYGFDYVTPTKVEELIDQSQNLPIEQIEEDLKDVR